MYFSWIETVQTDVLELVTVAAYVEKLPKTIAADKINFFTVFYFKLLNALFYF